MKKIILLISFLTIKSFLTDFAMGQEILDGSDNSNVASIGPLDSYKNPASTKDEIERQLNELNKLKTIRIDELQEWEKLISIIEKLSSEIKKGSVDIDSRWSDIETLLKNNNDRSNNILIIQGLNEIINFFSTKNYDFYYYSKSESTMSFIRDLYYKIDDEFNKMIKDNLQINLIRKLNISLEDGKDISNDPRINQINLVLIENLKKILNNTTFSTISKSISELLDAEKLNAIKQKDKTNSELTKINEYYKNLVKAKEDKDISINHEAIKWGLPLFCFTVIILFYGAFFYRKLSLKAVSKNTEIENTDQEQITKVLLEVITVLLLTMTVLILGLSRILTENVLGTLLGGIAGYILNKKQT